VEGQLNLKAPPITTPFTPAPRSGDVEEPIARLPGINSNPELEFRSSHER